MGQMVISFREALEAALLVGILVTYLQRTGRGQFVRNAVYGALTALLAGVAVAGVVVLIYGGLREGSKELFEGLASLLAVAVLTYMVYWMATKGKGIKEDIEKKIESSKSSIAIASASFVFVVREVIETVLFLFPFAIRDALGTAIGGISGLLLALAVSYGLFVAGMRLDLKKFFTIQASSLC